MTNAVNEKKPLLQKKEDEKTDDETEASKYVNLYFFEIKQSILFTYMYLFSSIMLSLVNRKIFTKFGFKFNFTLMILQQFMGIFCFQFLFSNIKNYKKIVGDVSVKEFFEKKFVILTFSLVFISNIMSSFIGNQKVNVPMFLCLRKYVLVMNFLYDYLIKKKDLPNYFGSSVIFLIIGATASGVSL
jgi:hypothetical protein